MQHVIEAQPTPACPRGVQGRLAVVEMFPITAAIRHAILTDPTEERIGALARAEGMITMTEDAMLKSFAGHVPFNEVHRLGGTLLSESVDVTPDSDGTDTPDALQPEVPSVVPSQSTP